MKVIKTEFSISTSISISISIVLSVAENNKKYSNIFYFYGDKEKWDEWRFHLNFKFRQSVVLFSAEKDKINYIRDHCKLIIFDILKARADPLSEDLYVTAKKIIAELYRIFNNYDKLEKCDAILYDLLFNIRVSKKNGNETFDEFYIRFSAIIASLRYKTSNASDRYLFFFLSLIYRASTKSRSRSSLIKGLRKYESD